MSAILDLVELGFPWEGFDPFLFTVHHLDHYPAGNDDLGPSQPLHGRNIGSDFSYMDGWSMYHGAVVPGFPSTPTAVSRRSQSSGEVTSTTPTPWGRPPATEREMSNG